MSSNTVNQRVNFASTKNPLEYPDFLEVQLKSLTENKAAKVEDGRLADVAPTILKIMGLEVPAEMDGNVLIK